jgi:ribosomal protein L9
LNTQLEEDMGYAQDAITSLLSAREKINLGVRWPLPEAAIAASDEKTRKAMHNMKDLIKRQANVRELKIVPAFDKVTITIKADAGKMGKEFKELAPKVIAHIISESPNAIIEHINNDGDYKFSITLSDRSRKEVAITKEHLIIEEHVLEPYVKSESRFGSVFLNK